MRKQAVAGRSTRRQPNTAACTGGVFALALVVALCAHGQHATQTLSLRPGWNAVFLEVNPKPNECAVLFKDTAVQSVWEWNSELAPMQFLSDPDELTPEEPQWFTWFPEAHPQAFLTNLYALRAGTAYLVELGGEAPMQLDIHGERVFRAPRWAPDSFNLAGFHVDPQNPPSFAEFFAPSEAHKNQAVFRLDTTGNWVGIDDPAKATLRSGEAYWIYTDGHSKYAGPLTIAADAGTSLEYGLILDEQTLHLTNATGEDKTVTLRPRASDRPTHRPAPEDGQDAPPLVEGDVPLSYFKVDKEAKEMGWEPVAGPIEVTVPAHGDAEVRLAVRRADMAGRGGGAKFRCESVLEVNDGQGSRMLMPVTASKDAATAGLWAGTARVTHVSEAANPQDSTTPTPASSALGFRVIVHVDDAGQAKLLQEVILLQLQATYKPDPDNPEFQIVDEPMRYVLLTDASLLPQFEDRAMRNGELTGRRISSPVFAFREPIDMSGGFPNTLSCVVEMPYDDPLNPFVHRYHPDHDNWDERYEQTLAEGKESYAFTREVELEFTDTNPNGIGDPGWGDEQVGGYYREAISGVHQNDIHIEGQFHLERVARIGVLNDGIE